MNINEKIEEIRNKPEHERLRYVWGAVIVSMFFIFLIWIFSIKISFQKNQEDAKKTDFPDFSEEFRDIKEKAPSLQDINLSVPPQNSSTLEGVSL